MHGPENQNVAEKLLPGLKRPNGLEWYGELAMANMQTLHGQLQLVQGGTQEFSHQIYFQLQLGMQKHTVRPNRMTCISALERKVGFTPMKLIFRK
jgi:hypothetical protein